MQNTDFGSKILILGSKSTDFQFSNLAKLMGFKTKVSYEFDWALFGQTDKIQFCVAKYSF